MLELSRKAHTHNNTLADSEPSWGSVNKTKLPRSAHADKGEAGKKSTWKYPHHWIKGGSSTNDMGIFTDGTMYLHRGGVVAAWAAANGARSGQQASQGVKNHIARHRKALGMNDKYDEKEVLEELRAQGLHLQEKTDGEKNPVEVVFKKTRDDEQVVYGVVYTPLYVDTDNETISPEDVMHMAWDFLATGKINKIDVQHDLKESGARVVESWIAREGDPDFPEGSWVMGVWCPDDLWKQVLDGELNGFSFYGTSMKYPAKVLMEVAKQIAGVTERSTKEIIPFHDHTFIVNVDNQGRIVSGKTDIVMEHSHLILKGTVTEEELDHSHRISLE